MINLCWHKKVIVFLAISCGISATAVSQQTQVRRERAVVLINSVSQDYDYKLPWRRAGMSRGSGSGFIIDGDRILTNAHNVSNSRYIEVKKQDQARRYAAEVAYIGHDCDLAILTVQDKEFFAGTEPVELGPIPEVNTKVSTYGFPVGGEHVSVTEGVVSRVQMDVYSHTGADMHLVIQTDAAINPGNSGGPVMQDGKVVGVAFQGLRQADNIGYMIPTTVIDHFLVDVADGRYDGFGSMGFTFYPGLHNQSYKEYLKVPAEQEGIVILQTLMNSSAETVLQCEDVITQIDSYDINNDGKAWIDGLQLMMSEVVERKQIGGTVELTFYRAGELMRQQLQIKLNRPVLEIARLYDKPPGYVVYGGLVFVSMSRNYLEGWGSGWHSNIPFYLRYLFRYSRQLNKDRERREYVVLAEIMPDEVNAYTGGFKNQPIESINDKTIFSLADVPEALAMENGDFCIIKFMGSDQPLILDAAGARQRNQQILDQYQVPADSRLEVEL